MRKGSHARHVDQIVSFVRREHMYAFTFLTPFLSPSHTTTIKNGFFLTLAPFYEAKQI
jgi:hypothetical protein